MSVIGLVIGAAFGSGALILQQSLDLSVLARFRVRAAALMRTDVTTVTWAMFGSGSGAIAFGLLRGAQASLLGLILGAAAGAWIHQQQLQSLHKQILLRQSLLTPAFLDMLAIMMATGVGLRSAMLSLLPKSDELVQQLWRPLVTDSDVSVVDCLQSVISGTTHSPTQRVANALIVSTERGTPIVDVLQSLAQEIRAEGRRQLLEIAAKKDVQMMLPVVFGILPSITAIALFPAVGSLTSLS